MTNELWALVAAIGLGFVYIIVQASALTKQLGSDFNAGPRDGMPELLGRAGRSARALKNFGETFPFFAAAILMAHVTGAHNNLTLWGAYLYVAGRAAYLPLYLLGISYVRSLAWGVASLGIVLILCGLS